ncbi:hypothetical protein [Chryseolinea lacunae]|uniref:3-oxoacyl-ACP synthase n=1 Tax=Chryseolinea lacunae TaxID=2801331 RepID=A0ABS1KPY8_9BACT|nr:hypothetical protein [Chryseolinea lacunae]MBL0741282.1 hypothetical protein [Chryseolinea lacunae]
MALGITRYSRIKDRTLVRQGEVVHTGADGSFDDFLDNALKALNIAYPKFYKMDRAAKLGFLGTEMLVNNTAVLSGYEPARVALVVANAHASLDTDIRYFETTKTMASPALFVYTLPNIVIGEICIRHGIKGENACFVLPAFDAQQLHDYVTMVMATEKTQACVAGWVDVLGDQHDVFLYLVEKKQQHINALEHTAEQLQKLYEHYGTVDGRS